tara:strand:+ start:319 stop:504 length:186 start_codon:yes stop_codon:yes gene_type:complete
MRKYYLGLDAEQAQHIELLRAEYEEQMKTKITASKFIRKLLFQGIEAVGFGSERSMVVSQG